MCITGKLKGSQWGELLIVRGTVTLKSAGGGETGNDRSMSHPFRSGVYVHGMDV